MAGTDADARRTLEGDPANPEGDDAVVGLRRTPLDGGDDLELRRLRKDDPPGNEEGPRQVLQEVPEIPLGERDPADMVSPDGESDEADDAEGGDVEGDAGGTAEERPRGSGAVSTSAPRLPEAIRQLVKIHPWSEGGALYDEAQKMGLNGEQAAFVMLRTLPPPHTQSVEQAERLLGFQRGSCATWLRNEKVGKAIIRASLAVSMCAAPEIFLRTVEMARQGDKFQTRMYYEHIAALAKDPIVMGSDFGRALAGVQDGEMAALTVIADKRRSNGRPKAS